jgi:hypothetical protein
VQYKLTFFDNNQLINKSLKFIANHPESNNFENVLKSNDKISIQTNSIFDEEK